MDEGKKPTPRIFTISEADELGDAIHDLIAALKYEKQRSCGILKSPDNTERDSSLHERTTQMISRLKFVAIALEHGSISFTEADMHVASILYHDTQLEMFHTKLDLRRLHRMC
jgi:hypothetical protein